VPEVKVFVQLVISINAGQSIVFFGSKAATGRAAITSRAWAEIMENSFFLNQGQKVSILEVSSEAGGYRRKNHGRIALPATVPCRMAVCRGWPGLSARHRTGLPWFPVPGTSLKPATCS
jgi:hypothetical protein